MNRSTSTWHRLSVGVIAVILVALGVATILWKANQAQVVGWVDRIDTDAVASFIDGDLWIWVLVGVAVVALIWGLSLIGSAIRPNSVGDVELAGSDASGTLLIAPKLLADAAKEELTANPLFTSVSAKATDDRSRQIIRLVVSTQAKHSYDEVLAPVETAVDELRAALGDTPVHIQAFVQMDK